MNFKISVKTEKLDWKDFSLLAAKYKCTEYMG